MRKSCLPFLTLAALAAPAALHADTYNFVITTADTPSTPGTSFTVAGTISGPADPYAPAAFDINTITGAANIYNLLRHRQLPAPTRSSLRRNLASPSTTSCTQEPDKITSTPTASSSISPAR